MSKAITVTAPSPTPAAPTYSTPLISTADPNYATDQTDVVPNVNVFESDNRSSYNALMLHLQGNLRRVNLVANYQLSKAQTWGCLLGELFDYVDGGLQTAEWSARCFWTRRLWSIGRRRSSPFRAGRHSCTFPAVFELSTVTQVRERPPITITNADNTGRIYVNGVYTSLDEFRGTPTSSQTCASRVLSQSTSDGRSTRSSSSSISSTVTILARTTRFNVVQLPVPQAQMATKSSHGDHQCTSICTVADCSQTVPVTSLKQLEIPRAPWEISSGLGTTVGIPFAAQLRHSVTF